MTQYIKLKIPFATKKYIKQESNGLQIRGYAFFIFDLNKSQYIDEFIVLEKANYQLTDKNMLATNYYNKELFKNFRTKFLDSVTNHNPEELKNIKHHTLDNNQLKKINEYFLNVNTTIRNMFACLSGSNPTGAELNNENSPILCTDTKYFRCNFLNPLKLFKAPKKDKKKIIHKDINEVELDEFIEKFNITINKNNQIWNFAKEFEKYNKWNEEYPILPLPLQNDIDEFQDYRMIKMNSNSNCKNDEKFKHKNNNHFNLFIDGYLNKTLNNNLDAKEFKRKLRLFYTWNVNYCIKNGYICDSSLIENISPKILDTAHIISFSSLVNSNIKNNILKAIDPYNCLRIDKNTHKLFDDHSIYFDWKNGNIVSIKNSSSSQYLDLKKLKEEQIKYLKESTKQNLVIYNKK